KLFRFLLILNSYFLLSACSGIPARTTLHYSPPSVMPVRTAIATAQDHAAAVKSALSSIPNSEFRIPHSAVALQTAMIETDALTHELLTAQTALSSVEKQANAQTDQLDKANEQKNLAITRAEEAASRYHK